MLRLFSFLDWLDKILLNYFPRPDHTEPIEEHPMNTDPEPTKATLENFCLSIRDYEGSPGDLNYKNNNPGNVRCSSVGYAKMYGEVQCVDTASGKFAKFSTPELGWLYLKNLVKSKVVRNPTWTIRQFMANYSPTGDGNNPNAYAIYIAKRLAVSPDYQMSEIVNA